MIVRHFLSWARNASAGERADATRALARAWLISNFSEDDRIAAESALLMMLDDRSLLVRYGLPKDVTPASLRRAVGQVDGKPRPRQFDRRRQPGQPGTDHPRAPAHRCDARTDGRPRRHRVAG